MGSFSGKMGLQRVCPLPKQFYLFSSSDCPFCKGAVPSNPGLNGKVGSSSVHMKSISGIGVKWSRNCS